MASNGIDPIVSAAITLAEQAIHNMKQGNGYNNAYKYQDYMTNGDNTAKDRCLEPMMRVKATGRLDQASDHIAYVALGLAYFLAGSPPSKMDISNG